MSEIENLHIKELRIDNYKSLKHSTIELQSGLNIIIGKNGAGKSNLLEFIYKYATLSNGNVYNWSYKTQSNNFSISYGYIEDNLTNIFSYTFERSRNQDLNSGSISNHYRIIFNKTKGDYPIIENLKFEDLLDNLGIFIISNLSLNNEIRSFSKIMKCIISYDTPQLISWISHPINLSIEDGQVNISEISTLQFFEIINFVLEFEFLKVSDVNIEDENDEIKEKLLSFLNNFIETSDINKNLEAFTSIKSIRASRNINIYKKADTIIVENLYIEFLIEEDWLPWYQLSDGTKRIFYLVSECIAANNQSIILIEEPELGIHPHQFYKVLDFLQEQAQTKQVIISTHSPMALDILKPNELDRITIAKYDKGTKFLKLDEVQKEKAKRYMEEVGELSYYWLHSDLEND